MNEIELLLFSITAFALGAVLTGLFSRYRRFAGWLAFISTLAGGIPAACVAWTALTHGPVQGDPLFVLPFFDQALVFEINQMSAVFMLITVLVAVCATLFSVHSMDRYEEYSLARYYPLLLIFFGAIIALLSVHNLLYFAILWEVMTLAAWALMAFDSDDEDASEGSLIYIIANHAATALMVLAIVILYVFTPDASFTFEAFRETIAAQLLANPLIVLLISGRFRCGCVANIIRWRSAGIPSGASFWRSTIYLHGCTRLWRCPTSLCRWP